MPLFNPQLVPVGKAWSIDSRADAILTNIPTVIQSLPIDGYATKGDGGAALYIRNATDPGTTDAFQSADGAWWKLAPQILNPKMFGCVVDGSTNDAVAYARLVSYVNALPSGATISYPAGNMVLTTTVHTFTKPVTHLGMGSAISRIILISNARIVCNGTRNNPLNTYFQFTGIGFLVIGSHTSGPLKVDFSTITAGGLSNTLLMDDVLVRGVSGTDSFAIGIELNNVPWPKLNNVTIIGDESHAPLTAGYGIKYTGTHGSGSFDQVRVYACNDAIWVEGEQEGCTFADCEVVQCQRGFTFLDTSNGLQPLYSVTGTHINCEEYCLKMTGITDFTIGEGNLFFCAPANGTATVWVGIIIVPTLATGSPDTLVCCGNISDCFIDASSAPGSITTKVGVNVVGKSVAIEDYTFDNVRFQTMNTGFLLDINTNQVVVSSSCTFKNVTNPFTNNGGDNVWEPVIISGTSVVTANGSGIAAIALPNLQALSPSILPTVCYGDDPTTFENLCVIQSSITNTGFNVQFRNSGGVAASVTRRVNWTAAGYRY